MSTREKLHATFPRLGELLVQRKLVSSEAIDHALALQRNALERSREAPRIGEILVRNRAISKKTIQQILGEQKVARGEWRTLNIESREDKRGIITLRLKGRLERETDAGLVKVLEKLMDRGVHSVVLDCEHLVSISSYSISSVIAYVDECRARGGDLMLCGLRAQPRIVFDQLNLLPFLSHFATSKEAAGAFSGQDAGLGTPSLSEFVSSFGSRHYHLSYCPDIKKLEEETRLYYMNRQNAQRGGKRPCQKCKP